MKLRNIVFMSFLILTSLAPSMAKAQGGIYLLPKFSFNYPFKGGDMSYGLGGGLGYHLYPSVAVETTYLRVLGSGGAPDSHIIEFDSVLSKETGSVNFLIQVGSGFYKISDPALSSGMTGLANIGLGLALNFIPSFNLRISSVYYILFKNKDLITGQAAIVLNF